MARSNKRAFTLIELLVVIAIIAILAAILFPVFARARAQSYAVGCASNENQEMKAFLMYSDDNGNKAVMVWFPGSNGMGCDPGCTLPGATPNSARRLCSTIDGGRQIPGWPYQLDTYRKSFDLLRCPSGGDDFGIYSGTNNPYYWWFNWSRFAQHGYNWAYFSPTPVAIPQDDKGLQWPRKLGMFQVPADTIVFVDSRVNTDTYPKFTWKRGFIAVDPPTCAECGATGQVYWFNPQGDPNPWGSTSPDPRHSDKLNVTMLDSHVKRYSIDAIGYDQRWDFTDN